MVVTCFELKWLRYLLIIFRFLSSSRYYCFVIIKMHSTSLLSMFFMNEQSTLRLIVTSSVMNCRLTASLLLIFLLPLSQLTYLPNLWNNQISHSFMQVGHLESTCSNLRGVLNMEVIYFCISCNYQLSSIELFSYCF